MARKDFTLDVTLDIDKVGVKNSKEDVFARQRRIEAEKEEERLNNYKLALLKKYQNEAKKTGKAIAKSEEEIKKEAEEKFAKLQSDNLKRTLKERREIAKKTLEDEIENLRILAEFEEDKNKRKKLQKEADRKELKKQLKEDAAEALSNALSFGIRAGNDSVKAGLNVYQQYMSGIEARLQGTGASFEQMIKDVRSNLIVSPYIKQTAVIENLNKLVSQGIAYNVEQRAFLETVAEKIATTFDATNGTLLRLIRIQQADTTAARLGLEANLTRYLNQNYQDTSYLSNQFDNVSESLYEATSLAGRNMGVELEYVVQKWLGSLYGVGASDALVQSLAQGIGYLGSGNISALSSNEGLQNLFVMAASRANLDYASMLTGGLSPTAANQLLSSVVSYIQEIGRTENVAIRSQYANIFGMTISDMTALLNLSTQDLKNISSNMLSYSQTIGEVEYQLQQVGKRTPLAEIVDNALANASLSLGLKVANNAVTYGIWKAGEVLDQLTGGLKLPEVSVLGTGVKLDMTYGQVLQAPIIGYGAVTTLLDAINSIKTNGIGLSLGSWAASEYTARGEGIVTTPYGTYEGVSSSAVFGNASEESIKESVTGAQEDAKSLVSGEQEEDTTLKDIHSYTFEMNDTLTRIRTILDDVITGVSAFKVDALYTGSTI